MSSLLQEFIPTLTRLMNSRKAKKRPVSSSAPNAGQHLKLSQDEHDLIVQQIEKDMRSARSAHQVRRENWRRWRRLWRDPEGMPAAGGEPNFHFPLVQGQIFERWAKRFQALFGPDAQVIAVPTRPTDLDRLAKVGLYVRWVIFNLMPSFVYRWLVFEFQTMLYGRAFAMLTYRKFYINHPTKGRLLYKETPDFRNIDPEDIFVPGQEVETLHGFRHFTRRYYATPDELLKGEQEEEIYFGIEENWDDIVQLAKGGDQRGEERADSSSEGKKATDDFQGVHISHKGYIEIWEWNSHWRMLESDSGDPKGKSKPKVQASEGGPAEDDRKESDHKPSSEEKREKQETEIVACLVPGLHKLIRCQKLAELYPDSANKRPYYESAMVRDGTYWSPGIPELLESIEKELTNGENLFTQAGQFSIGPLIFYKTASGFNPDTFRYEPSMCVPTENPGADVNVVRLAVDPTFFTLNQQSKLGMIQRIMGASDFSAGQQINRPNAPKTARATIALLEQGNLRVGLDIGILLLQFAELLKRVWELCVMFAPPEQFFRVTGEDAEGLMQLDRGFASMKRDKENPSQDDFAGEYDFELKPATGPHAKEALKDDYLHLFTILMQLPFVQANPYAQYMLAVKLAKFFNFDLAKLLPKPQKPEISMDPKEEWLLLLKGAYDEVTLSPADDDQAHLLRHNRDLMQMAQGDDEHKKPDAMDRMIDHIKAHKKQDELKAAAQAQMQVLMQNVQQMMAQTGNRFGEQDQGEGDQGKGGVPMPQQVAQQTGPPGLNPGDAQAAPGAGGAMLGG
jgi:hypothetical protein